MTDATITLNPGSGGPLMEVDDANSKNAQYVKLYYGESGTKTHVAEETPLPISDPRLQLARGHIDNYSPVSKFGANPDVDTGSTPEGMWSEGGLWCDTAPTVAQTYEIASADAADAAAGTGMRTVFISGLDSSWNEVSETVTLNGTTDVTTVNTYWRITRMYGASWGTGRVNAGKITATGTTDANVMAAIADNGTNQTQMACYTVPDGKTLYVDQYSASLRRNSASGANATVQLITREADATLTSSGWRIRHELTVSITGGAETHRFFNPLAITEKMDVLIRVADISDDNTGMVGGFEGTLVTE